MKIAKFKRMGEGSFDAYGEEGCFMERHDGYIRLTEYAEVELKPLRTEDVVQKQLHALDSAESELRSRFQQALNEVNRQREELRAITYQS